MHDMSTPNGDIVQLAATCAKEGGAGLTTSSLEMSPNAWDQLSASSSSSLVSSCNERVARSICHGEEGRGGGWGGGGLQRRPVRGVEERPTRENEEKITTYRADHDLSE